MKKVIVLYGLPLDPAAFNLYYEQTHVPLVLKLPHLKGYEISRGPVLVGQDPSKHHLIALLSYASQADLDASLGSAEGAAAVADLANFATGGVEIITIDTHSFQ